MADFNLDVALENENLTEDEKSFIRGINNRNSITSEDEFKKAVTEAQKECAIATSKKGLLQDGSLQVKAEEIKRAWDVLSKAEEDDAVKQARTDMQNRSEEAMKLAEQELNNGGLSDNAAMDMQEWLEINKTLKNSQNSDRNKKIGKALQDQLKEFDSINGLDNVSPKDVAKIKATQGEFEAKTKDYDPLAKDENGQTDDRFKDIAQFYDNLKIQDSDEQKKAEFVKNMVELARLEAVNQLSVDPKFRKMGEQEKQALMLDTWKSMLEQGIASIVIAQEAVANGERFNKANFSKSINKKGKTTELSAKFQAHIAEGKPLTISEDVAYGVCSARLQIQEDFNKRLTQKTGSLSFINKARAKINDFKKSHPKIAATMKFLGTVGLTVGVSMIGGAAGIAALGAYRTYKAVRKGIKECGSLKKMLKSPKHMVTIATNVASVAIAGYGVMELGSAANGMLGNLGVSGTVDAMKTMAGDAVNATWNAVTHPIDSVSSMAKGVWHGAKWTYNHLTDGNIGNTAGKTGNFLSNSWHNLLHPTAAVDAATASGNETARVLATQRVGRLFVGVSGAVGNIGAGLHDVMTNPKYKGKRLKQTWQVVKKGALGALLSVAGYEIGTHYANASLNAQGNDGQDLSHSGTGGGNGDHSHEGNYVETQEAQRFNQIFQGENEENLEKACRNAPSTVIKDLQAKGILKEDYKLTSWNKLLNDIRHTYAHNPELNPQELSDYVNDNQERFLSDMKASNAEQAARRAAAAARRQAAEEARRQAEEIEKLKEAVKFKIPADNDEVKLKDLEKAEEDQNLQPKETAPTEQSPKAKTPSVERMKDFTKALQRDYNKTGRLHVDAVLQKEIEEGRLEAGEAERVRDLWEKTYEAKGRNIDKMFRDINKGTKQLLEEEQEQAKVVEQTQVKATEGTQVKATEEVQVTEEKTKVKTNATNNNQAEAFVAIEEVEKEKVIVPSAEQTGQPQSFEENKQLEAEKTAAITNSSTMIVEDVKKLPPETQEMIKNERTEAFAPSQDQRSAAGTTPEVGDTLVKIVKSLQSSRAQGVEFNAAEAVAQLGIAHNHEYVMFYENFGKQINNNFTDDDLNNFVDHYTTNHARSTYPEAYGDKEIKVLDKAANETKAYVEKMKQQLDGNTGNVTETTRTTTHGDTTTVSTTKTTDNTKVTKNDDGSISISGTTNYESSRTTTIGNPEQTQESTPQNHIDEVREKSVLAEIHRAPHHEIEEGKLKLSYALTDKGFEITDDTGTISYTSVKIGDKTHGSFSAENDSMRVYSTWADERRQLVFEDPETKIVHAGLSQSKYGTSGFTHDTKQGERVFYYGGAARIDEQRINQIAVENMVYQDILARNDTSVAAENFKAMHEAHLKANHLIYNPEKHRLETNYKSLAKELDENGIKEKAYTDTVVGKNGKSIAKKQLKGFLKFLEEKSGMKIH